MKGPLNCTDSELSIYLQALEEGCCPTFYSDTTQSAPSRTMSIASKSYRNGKKTVSFHGFPSLAMSRSSMDNPGEDSSMSLRADFPVKMSAPQARVLDSMANALASGVNSLASFARYDPDTHSLRTAQCLLFEDSTECCATLPRWGWMQAGVCWELPMSARPIFERGSGLWRTPDASVVTGGAANAEDRKRQGHAIGLHDQVNTPSMWPTPGAAKANNDLTLTCSGDGREKPNKLGWAVAMATPTARDWKSGKASQATMGRNSRPLSEQIGGHLSCDWTELLMGWPAGWTSLEPLQDATLRGWPADWEDGVPRVATGVPNRVQRLRAIGNGQVPQCAAMAWVILA